MKTAYITKVFALAAAVSSAMAVAADSSESTGQSQKWHCVDVASAGIRWNSDTDTYRDASFFMMQYIIEQKGDQLVFPKTMGFADKYTCGFRDNSPVLTCKDPVHIFNMNMQTGLATHGKTYGWMDPYSRPDSMFVSALTCRTQ